MTRLHVAPTSVNADCYAGWSTGGELVTKNTSDRRWFGQSYFQEKVS